MAEIVDQVPAPVLARHSSGTQHLPRSPCRPLRPHLRREAVLGGGRVRCATARGAWLRFRASARPRLRDRAPCTRVRRFGLPGHGRRLQRRPGGGSPPERPRRLSSIVKTCASSISGASASTRSPASSTRRDPQSNQGVVAGAGGRSSSPGACGAPWLSSSCTPRPCCVMGCPCGLLAGIRHRDLCWPCILEVQLDLRADVMHVADELFELAPEGSLLDHSTEEQANRYFTSEGMRAPTSSAGLRGVAFVPAYVDSADIDDSVWHVLAVGKAED